MLLCILLNSEVCYQNESTKYVHNSSVHMEKWMRKIEFGLNQFFLLPYAINFGYSTVCFATEQPAQEINRYEFK